MTPFVLDAMGLVAAALTTAAFVPQAWRIWQTRSANDISWLMFLVSAAGNAMWFAYGWMLQSLPLIASSSVTFTLVCTILILKWRFSRSLG
jgi:MtN3 and saliva related transmembrane protein